MNLKDDLKNLICYIRFDWDLGFKFKADDSMESVVVPGSRIPGTTWSSDFGLWKSARDGLWTVGGWTVCVWEIFIFSVEKYNRYRQRHSFSLSANVWV